jgi:hypothetical protein
VNSVFREDSWSQDIPLVIQEQLEVLPEVRLTQEVQLDAAEGIVTRSLSSLNLWGFSASFTADRLEAEPDFAFEPAQVSASYKLAEQELYLWNNRIHLQATLSSGWNMNLRDPRQNNLDFSFTFRMFVHEFLEVAFTSVSYNNQTYKYFRRTAAAVGVPYVNPLEALRDLGRSFNFFNEADRRESDFNLKSINLTLIHHLHDWDLTLQYSGQPELTFREDVYRYEWNSTFSIQLQWIPIPELRSTLRGDRVGQEPLDFTLRGTEP